MKIVKFKDGMYGIRRKFLGILWYQYLSVYEDKWFSDGDIVSWFCKYEIVDVNDRLEKYTRSRNPLDYGEPI